MTIINVLLVTNDTEYSHRLRRYISEKHSEIKLTLTNNTNELRELINSSSFNVILIGDEFKNIPLDINAGMSCCYLCSRDMGDNLNGIKCFCKYRSGETICSLILELYSEVSSDRLTGSTGTPIFAFTAANGGAGSTVISASFAIKLANCGKKVLFFSFDRFILPTLLFDGESHACMSDFIFAVLASEKRSANLSLKAASMLSTDSSGVKYMNGCKTPADMNELTPKQLSKAFAALQTSDEYNAIVVDIPLEAPDAWAAVQSGIKHLFIVTEAGSIPEQKLSRTIDYFKINDTRKNTELLSRGSIIINKDSRRQEQIEGSAAFGTSITGSVPKYRDDNTRAVINAISRLNMWNEYI